MKDKPKFIFKMLSAATKRVSTSNLTAQVRKKCVKCSVIYYFI